tara:strand:- start:164 stop:283 length:120 start_codon:yes stop_codon:yes gene_type:complete
MKNKNIALEPSAIKFIENAALFFAAIFLAQRNKIDALRH